MTLSPIYTLSHCYKSPVAKSQVASAHKVQLYLDYNCPYSTKIFKKIHEDLLPLIDQKHPGKFEFILMNVPQPWHPVSTLMHEVLLAVAKVSPQTFWDFSYLLFCEQLKFFDSETDDKTRPEIYNELVDLATSKFPELKKEELLDWVLVDKSNPPTNKGNKISKDMKYFIRYQRTVGVHVTPTVAINGIVNPLIESSNSIESWVEILESYI